jgi:hypothetical protein
MTSPRFVRAVMALWETRHFSLVIDEVRRLLACGRPVLGAGAAGICGPSSEDCAPDHRDRLFVGAEELGPECRRELLFGARILHQQLTDSWE